MPYETKAARIIRLAQDGVDYGAIATAVGSTRRSVSTTVSSARKSGIDIPSHRVKWRITFDRNLAVALARDGIRPGEIARKLGTTGVCVSYLICAARRGGVDIPNFPVGWPRRFAATNTTIIRMAKSGMHVGDIAAAVGTTDDAIHPILSAARKQNASIPRQKRENPDRAAVIALAGAGMRPCAIAAQLGIRRRKVYATIRTARQGGAVIPPFKPTGVRSGVPPAALRFHTVRTSIFG